MIPSRKSSAYLPCSFQLVAHFLTVLGWLAPILEEVIAHVFSVFVNVWFD